MNATIRRQVQAELDDLIGVLREISAEDWDRPSSCEGFRVRDVAGHRALVLQPVNGRAIKMLAGSFTRFMRLAGEWSVENGEQHTPAELIDLLEQRRATPTKGIAPIAVAPAVRESSPRAAGACRD